MAEAIKKSAAVSRERVWRLSVDQYHAMVRFGILTSDDPVELLEKWLIPKMPKNRSRTQAYSEIENSKKGSMPVPAVLDTGS